MIDTGQLAPKQISMTASKILIENCEVAALKKGELWRQCGKLCCLIKGRATVRVINEGKRKGDTLWAMETMRVKAPSQRTKIRSLSGGNQQKVILGRWLLTEPEVLMLDEPTRGIDVGAKFEIYKLIVELASKGKAVIMVSGELPELLGVCDRICVMSGGRLVGEVDAKNTSQEEIMRLAAENV